MIVESKGHESGFIYNAVFERPEMEREIMAELAPDSGQMRRAPAGTPVEFRHLWEVPLLTRDEERHLFRQMNFLLFKASRVRGRRADERRQQLLDEAVAVRNRIMRANLRLAVNVARKQLARKQNFAQHGEMFDEGDLHALISDANMSLLRAIAKFDYARGNRFSTYAVNAMVKNFMQDGARQSKRDSRQRTNADLTMELAVQGGDSEQAEEQRVEGAKAYLAELLDTLEERERQVLRLRFNENMTLEEVGRVFGITKERVRQIEARALAKLRGIAQEDRVDV